MPYVLIRGNLSSYSHKYPFRVLVSGLKGISFPFKLIIYTKNRLIFPVFTVFEQAKFLNMKVIRSHPNFIAFFFRFSRIHST